MKDKVTIENETIDSIIHIFGLFGLMVVWLIMFMNDDILNMTDDIGQKISIYTKEIYFYSFLFFIYWIIILLRYEIDRKLAISYIDEEELFEKYNPILAGCFEGARDILPRDIIAVILNLINKKYIKLEIKNNLKGKDNYKYYIEKVPHLENKMDNIEKFIYDWFFECGYYINNKQIDLIETLRTLPTKKQSGEKFELLNIIVQERLNKIGANKNDVPTGLKIINTIIFIFSIIAIISHINLQNIMPEFNIKFENTRATIMAIIIILTSMAVTILVINLFLKLRDKITERLCKITEKKIITTIITVVFVFLVGLIILMICNVKLTKHLIADIILLFITLIIMMTDDLMLKNNINRVEDFSRLQLLKKKIKNYTLLNEKDIEQIALWEKYLTYAVSFGITEKIQNKFINVELDNELLQIIRSTEFNTYIVSEYYSFCRNSNINPKRFNI